MREILFRGKSQDTGEWVEGYLVKCKWYLDDSDITCIIPLDAMFFPHSEISWLEAVVPETVGQWTGLVDKNGTKIFEGDVIHYSNEVTYEVRWNSTELRYWVRGLDYNDEDGLYNLYEDYIITIGNIHDNPELLQKE